MVGHEVVVTLRIDDGIFMNIYCYRMNLYWPLVVRTCIVGVVFYRPAKLVKSKVPDSIKCNKIKKFLHLLPICYLFSMWFALIKMLFCPISKVSFILVPLSIYSPHHYLPIAF